MQDIKSENEGTLQKECLFHGWKWDFLLFYLFALLWWITAVIPVRGALHSSLHQPAPAEPSQGLLCKGAAAEASKEAEGDGEGVTRDKVDLASIWPWPPGYRYRVEEFWAGKDGFFYLPK